MPSQMYKLKDTIGTSSPKYAATWVTQGPNTWGDHGCHPKYWDLYTGAIKYVYNFQPWRSTELPPLELVRSRPQPELGSKEEASRSKTTKVLRDTWKICWKFNLAKRRWSSNGVKPAINAIIKSRLIIPAY